MITLSIVSHNQANLVQKLLTDLEACLAVEKIVITQNLPEQNIHSPETLASKIVHIRNADPQGFGANHNAAFLHCTTPYFCVMNPDIRCSQNPFVALLKSLEKNNGAIVGPLVKNPAGSIEDSARQFPTAFNLLAKVLGLSDGRYQNIPQQASIEVDWIAGMFMLMRSSDFQSMGGFDEKFHLYYEDVDLCARLQRQGKKVLLCTEATVVHDARRTSHRNLRYMKWHLMSMLRYLWKHYSGSYTTRTVR